MHELRNVGRLNNGLAFATVKGIFYHIGFPQKTESFRKAPVPLVNRHPKMPLCRRRKMTPPLMDFLQPRALG